MTTLLDIYRDGFPEDGDDYSAWFVGRYAHTAVTVEDGGRPVAAGYLLPKKLAAFDRTEDVWFLDAFSALTPYRGRGVAPALMKKIEARAKDRGIRFIFLSPFDGRYYRRYGFADVVTATYRTIAGGEPLGIRRASATDIKHVYDAMTLGADVYFARDGQFYADCAADHLLVGDGIAAGTVWHNEFEVTACTDYDALLRCEALKGLVCAVPGAGDAFVQVLDLDNPGVSPFTGTVRIVDKL